MQIPPSLLSRQRALQLPQALSRALSTAAAEVLYPLFAAQDRVIRLTILPLSLSSAVVALCLLHHPRCALSYSLSDDHIYETQSLKMKVVHPGEFASNSHPTLFMEGLSDPKYQHSRPTQSNR